MRKITPLAGMAILLLVLLLAVLPESPAAAAGQQTATRQRFIDHHDGTVTDTRTGLMWAASDNGADIQWWDAERYCREYRGGGHTDWRLPTPDELATLYDPARKGKAPFAIVPAIRLTERCPWTSTTNLNAAVCLSFATGKKAWARRNDSFELRVLPVRDPRDSSRQEQH